tara:strand:- start:602 stop:895 length:294 start_codon:yes stop_codon:yes gene_type:complete
MTGTEDVRDIVLWLIVANVGAFCLMVWDKEAARIGSWRISEKTLILSSLVGGSIGALCASILARHKTRKQPIATILRAMPLLHAGLALFWAERLMLP